MKGEFQKQWEAYRGMLDHRQPPTVDDLRWKMYEALPCHIFSLPWHYLLGYSLGIRLAAEDIEAAMQHVDSLGRALEAADRAAPDYTDATNMGIIDAVTDALNRILAADAAEEDA